MSRSALRAVVNAMERRSSIGMALVAFAFLGLGSGALSCAGAPPLGEGTVSGAPATPPAPSAPSSPSSASTPAPALAPHGSASPGAGSTLPELPRSEAYRAERILVEPALSLAPGRAGRLAVIVDEAGRAVPWRFEAGDWKRLELPEAERAASRELVAGMYFGRDDRPRLMGYTTAGGSLRMIYLRYKDGAWRGEPTEIGRLGGPPPAELFGVLGWDDPEIVCKKGDVCLIKSRAGWQEIPPSLPPTRVVRAFGGRGYALTEDGLLRADKSGFTRVGPPAPWKTPATGFWVGDDGAIAVAEPAADAIHTLASGSAEWQTSAAPIDAPADVLGPEGSRFVVGGGGIAHGGQGAFRRVGDPSWSFSFVIALDGGAVAAGPSGVVRISPATPE